MTLSRQALAQQQRHAQATIDAYHRDLPYTVTVTDALAMPYGWQRNVVLRKALRLERREVGMINSADVVQIAVPSATRKNAVSKRLTLPTGWNCEWTRRADGKFLATCRHEGDTDG